MFPLPFHLSVERYLGRAFVDSETDKIHPQKPLLSLSSHPKGEEGRIVKAPKQQSKIPGERDT